LGRLRHIILDGEPWFHATDICRILGLTTRSGTSQHTGNLDSSEKRTLMRTLGQIEGLHEFIGNTGQATAISESGLYKLTLRRG
jgi:prophage antirepressor-like protein